ncbi:PTS sugar transporter subunit IIB [Atopobiaceae bacterium HCP3S3_F7]
MVSIVLASHGRFAEGIKESGSMIFGPQEDVAAVVLTPDMGPDDMHQKLLGAISTFSDQEHVLFLVDLWGGTPFNQVSRLITEEGHEDWVAITGLNLPMLVSAYGSRMGADTAVAVMQEIFADSRGGIKVKPEELEPAEAATVAAPAPVAASGAAIPEGTVLGDGHIKYAYVRIDTRLLHGQVATAWTKQVQPDRILVVSDGVAHDELRKNMIIQAAPPGVHVHVIPISKLVQVDKDPRFGATKAMVLFENPQDLLRAEEGGVKFPEVCIGSMAASQGKTVINQAIACDADDVRTLEAIRDNGTHFYVQKVPSDRVDDIWALLKAKNMA